MNRIHNCSPAPDPSARRQKPIDSGKFSVNVRCLKHRVYVNCVDVWVVLARSSFYGVPIVFSTQLVAVCTNVLTISFIGRSATCKLNH